LDFGISSIIRPLPFQPALAFDLAVCVMATLLLFVTMFLGKKHILERWQGGIFVAVYVGYIWMLIVRG
jgi:cation:H+ antiporter